MVGVAFGQPQVAGCPPLRYGVAPMFFMLAAAFRSAPLAGIIMVNLRLG